MEKEEQRIYKHCGCQGSCSFGLCAGNGQISILKIIPGGYEKIDRVRVIGKDSEGIFYLERFCRVSDGWVRELISPDEIKTILAN